MTLTVVSLEILNEGVHIMSSQTSSQKGLIFFSPVPNMKSIKVHHKGKYLSIKNNYGEKS